MAEAEAVATYPPLTAAATRVKDAVMLASARAPTQTKAATAAAGGPRRSRWESFRCVSMGVTAPSTYTVTKGAGDKGSFLSPGCVLRQHGVPEVFLIMEVHC